MSFAGLRRHSTTHCAGLQLRRAQRAYETERQRLDRLLAARRAPEQLAKFEEQDKKITAQVRVHAELVRLVKA